MIPTEPGIYRDVTEDEYNAIEAHRRSFGWRVVEDSPHHARYAQDHPRQTEPLAFGSMAHMAVLQPEEFPRRYQVMPPFEADPDNLTKQGKVPDSPKATKYYKDKVKAFTELCGRQGVLITPQVDFDMAYRIGRNVREHEEMERFFKRSARTEATALWRDEVTGLLLKARYDCLVEGEWPTAVDLKTAASAHPREFMSHVRRFGYAFQQVWYLEGLVANGLVKPNFLFAVGEKKGDNVVMVYRLPAETVDAAYLKYRKALETIALCEQSGEWPAYGTGIVDLRPSQSDLFELKNGG